MSMDSEDTYDSRGYLKSTSESHSNSPESINVTTFTTTNDKITHDDINERRGSMFEKNLDKEGKHFLSTETLSPIGMVPKLMAENTATSFIKPDKLAGLVLLQLDLIEQQQQSIYKKDKQIISLKNEKEQLEARLSRMERRISVVQKKHSIELAATPSHDEVLKQKSTILPLKSPSEMVLTPSNKKTNFPVDNLTDKVNLIPITVTSCNDKDIIFDNFLRTNVNYLESRLDRSHVNKTDKSAKVPVPPWKLLRDKNDFDFQQVVQDDEVLEDISDSAYEKRHSKPEQEEKRRKRWDLQQARQQRQHEILVQRYNEREQKGKSQNNQNISKENTTSKVTSPRGKVSESICKDSDEFMAIEISEIVPVCAFGYPVPCLPSRELDLPWFSIAKREVQLRKAKQKHILKAKKRSKCLHSVGKRKR